MSVLDQDTAVMVEDLLARAREAVVVTLNEAIDKVDERSVPLVPQSENHEIRTEGDYPDQPLVETQHIDYASGDDLTAQLTYDAPYATAQEVGTMEYNDRGTPVVWQATQYTTPGTQAHFLGDAVKSVIGELEPGLEINAKMAFSDTQVIL